MIAKKINVEHGYFYASKSYINKLGNPSTLDELNHADFIGFNSTSAMICYLNNVGLKLTKNNFPLLTENRMVQWELVKLGTGIGLLPDYIGESDAHIEKVLPNQEPLIGELWLVAHRELKTNQRVRIVYDFLISQLNSQ